ncbi:zinc ABC transporter substrate-binding protein [bacterium]|nr:zinc ABC transporter substrate-binding protein [bacterium]
MKKSIGLAIMICVFITFACAKGENAKAKNKIVDEGAYPVFVTIQPLASIAESLAGEYATVHVILDPGTDPHTYEPLPEDILRLANSAMLFHIGMGFDDWASKIALEAEDGPRIYPVSMGVPMLPAVPDNSLDRLREENLMPTKGNPHVWLDPKIVADIIIPTMARAFASADPPNSEFYMVNAQRLQKHISSLADSISIALESHKGESVILHHGSFAYFCRRFKLDAVEVIQPFPGMETSPANLIKIIENAKKENAVAILSEPLVSQKIAQAVAEELGIPIISVDPLGKSGEGYIELMKRNTNEIIDGLE